MNNTWYTITQLIYQICIDFSVIQYGFVTLFVVAFPLAPLFALINNVFEMRLDAKKFLKYYRRPVPNRVKDIGVWFNIMAILGRIAVVSSVNIFLLAKIQFIEYIIFFQAFIIAFSSNFIPRMVYMIRVNHDHTDEGYLNHTLAFFNTNDFQVTYFSFVVVEFQLIVK